MNNDLLNILSHSNKDIDNQKLMDYLSGKLSGQEKHEVEKWMADNDFANDAMEGLEAFKASAHLSSYVDQLNKDLHQYLQQKKNRRKKRRLQDPGWIYFAIVLILALIAITYAVIHLLKHQ